MFHRIGEMVRDLCMSRWYKYREASCDQHSDCVAKTRQNRCNDSDEVVYRRASSGN